MKELDPREDAPMLYSNKFECSDRTIRGIEAAMKRLACTAIGFDAHLSFLACLQSLAWSARLVNVADAPVARMVQPQTWVIKPMAIK
ncbi:hypothetical protein RB195_001082 [Necator americanus]|uniref:Uncharacterized protein n=1 Tax=Necator americanus TaxID=51031 RepID=A0ABR1DCR4_NECAM